MNYWLMKSEPSIFGIGDLVYTPHQCTLWDGVRNYQARSFMRDMRLGDGVFFYHSNCAEPGIVGIMRVAREAYPDPTRLDKCGSHYAPRSIREAPRWSAVELEFIERFDATVALSKLREVAVLKTLVNSATRESIVRNACFKQALGTNLHPCTQKTSKKAHKNK